MAIQIFNGMADFTTISSVQEENISGLPLISEIIPENGGRMNFINKKFLHHRMVVVGMDTPWRVQPFSS